MKCETLLASGASSDSADPAQPSAGRPVAWIDPRDLERLQEGTDDIAEVDRCQGEDDDGTKFVPLYASPIHGATEAEIIERCAKVAEEWTRDYARDSFIMTGPVGVGRGIAAAIRALTTDGRSND